MYTVNIGIDDTDSNEYGMCTTYLAAVIDSKLKELGFKRAGLPRLIRLNPACPYKTRGNGAVHLSYLLDSRAELAMVEDVVDSAVEKLAVLKDPHTDPGIVYVVYRGDHSQTQRALSGFYRRAVQGIVGLEEALTVLVKTGGRATWYKSGRGVIGALAAISAPSDAEATYELLAYRGPSEHQATRLVDAKSVMLADIETWPDTYDSYDWYSRETLVAPHTPCPVLVGIRGRSLGAVLRAYRAIKLSDTVVAEAIFVSNQGSGDHIVAANGLADVKPYTTVAVGLEICSEPKNSVGGHVFVWGCDRNGRGIRLAAYEPTGHFRKIVFGLEPGDRIVAVGSFVPRSQHPPTINLEALRVCKLAIKYSREAPRCPKCGSRMKSLGKENGYRCPKCGFRDRNARPITRRAPRRLVEGFYLAPPRAHRHLTTPIEAFVFWGRRREFRALEC